MGCPDSISIHALREEGDAGGSNFPVKKKISIHALREEGDAGRLLQPHRGQDFYPRPPRGGRLHLSRTGQKDVSISIHALREEGDHPLFGHPFLGTGNFYPRPPRGGRPSCLGPASPRWGISIHALREEGDREQAAKLIRDALFLSTPSARRATVAGHPVIQISDISIHALREEGDAEQSD